MEKDWIKKKTCCPLTIFRVLILINVFLKSSHTGKLSRFASHQNNFLNSEGSLDKFILY